MISSLLESAVRSLLVAGVVWAGLRAFRIRSVLAQKTVWGLVLGAAILMPLLLPLAARWQGLPIGATVVLPRLPLESLATKPASTIMNLPPTKTLNTTAPVTVLPDAMSSNVSKVSPPAARISNRFPDAASSDSYRDDPITSTKEKPVLVKYRIAVILELAWLLYLSVMAGLLLRLLYGLASAFRLWRAAAPVSLDAAQGSGELRLRSSHAVASPVTIGSGVVLPADYADWDAEKLRIVLAHERSHIRQGDFYLQLIAALYAVLFWFSPLGWWLKRKLSDLAEAISDRAGLCEAVSRSSYAQILLEFAATPRPTPIGVAMARSGSLSRRIDRLLNDSAFQQAFAAGRYRIAAAVLLVPVALFAATSLVRVQAAAQAQPQPAPLAQPAPAAQPAPEAQPAPAPQPEAPAVGQVAPEPDIDSAVPPVPDPALAPPAPPAPAVPGDRVIVIPKIPGRVIVVPNPPRRIVVPEVPETFVRVPYAVRVMALARNAQAVTSIHSGSDVSGHGSSHSSYFANGDFHALVTGNWDNLSCCAWMASRRAEFDKIRKQAHGDFLWFHRGGKSYFVDDPATLARVEALYKQMEELGRQQEALGKQQEALGMRQEALGKRQAQSAVIAPDLSKEIAEVNAAIASLQTKQGKTMTQQDLSDLQDKLGELQGRLGMLQGKIGAQMGSLGAQQGKLGAEQGRLGAEQGRLGAQQGMLSLKADRTVKSIIDESLKNGKAHPVQ